MERVNEQRLLQRLRLGDTEAFAGLYRANAQAVYRYIAFRVNDARLAEDLTGDVFIRAFKSIGSYQDQGKPFIAWLYRIAHARVVDHYRQQDRRPASTPLDDEPLEASGDMDANLLQRQASNVLREAISDLTDEQQQVIILRFIEGQRIEMVAQQMGKNANAIKALQHRALHALAVRLERAGFDIETVLAGMA
ncbi:MAG: sigma-70 family RNA polymerase sigma factor [Chloroflexi bacterium]|nr:sigma-70 family RNA polymerase sigma factor [Chloroflexota bacterium]MCC6892103.1 sigma-70 family RNA polymerase sigma factor [Anaerolineae bacterium]